MVEYDIRLVLDEYNFNFIRYELQPGIYIFKDLSEVLLRNLQSEFEGFNNAIGIEFADITMKTNIVCKTGIYSHKFDEKSFFSSYLDFNPHWD